MARQACTLLHREKKSLYAAKNLLTKFRGDDAYILCGSLNDPIDEHIFDIEAVYNQCSTARVHLRTSKSPPATPPADANSSSETLNIVKPVIGQPVADADTTITDSMKDITNSEQEAGDASTAISMAQQNTSDVDKDNPGEDEHTLGTAMEGIETKDNAVAPEANMQEITAPNETQSRILDGSPLQLPEQHAQDRSSPTTAVGQASSPAAVRTVRSPRDRVLPSPESLQNETTDDVVNATQDALPTMTSRSTSDEQVVKSTEDAEDEVAENESQPEPRRMRTRAQAQAASDHSVSSRTKSPSPAARVIHPLFKIPEPAHLDRDFGLPPNEAEETRRLLMAYVQKQEEIVRGAEQLYEGLLRADRMRQTVYKWCKADGHVGEMSDGEDWYDKEEWGLEEDLEKGKDEEEETATQGKKTRGKTRQQ